MFIIKYKKIFVSISAILVLASIISIFTFDLKFGVDFTGGSITEVSFSGELPAQNSVIEKVESVGINQVSVRQAGDDGYIIKTQVIDDATKNNLVESIGQLGEVPNVDRFNTVGPTLGNELKSRALLALIILVTAIILFIAYTFRQVSKPVSSWKYGLVAIIALVHDILITIGVFVVLGNLWGLEIDTLFVTALLVILGYSINDTIVVLDRVRENLKDLDDNVREQKFDKIVGQSLSETFTRSINTSLTTLLALLALYFVGGDSTKNFALALVVGIIAGSYSSIFIAAPMLIWFKNKKKQGK